jgi:SAM-dependent methyltransferase
VPLEEEQDGMPASTIDLMKAALAAGGERPNAILNIVADQPASDAGRGVTPTEATHTRWGEGIRLADDLVLLPEPAADAVPRWMTSLYGDRRDTGRLRPMNPDSIPRGLTRSWRYVTFLRRRAEDPETFHRFLAADTVCHLRALMELRGARTLDVGGQAGYMSEALRDEGAVCHVVEHRCPTLEPHDGRTDRALVAGADRLPVASGSLDLVYSSDVLQHVTDPGAMLSEVARVLKPGTGIGYLAFTNARSPLARIDRDAVHHPVSVAAVLDWFAGRHDVALRNAEPRFWPAWANRVVEMPRLREYATVSLRVVFRRTC